MKNHLICLKKIIKACSKATNFHTQDEFLALNTYLSSFKKKIENKIYINLIRPTKFESKIYLDQNPCFFLNLFNSNKIKAV